MSENLQETTAAAVAEPAAEPEAKQPKKRGTIKCLVLRDYWDADGERVCAGSEVNLPAEDAIDGVESGALSRVKDADK